jgi:hypothetical protein
MFTPWGVPKQTHRLEQGITYVVATRGSGLMLSRGYAERHLSAAARRRAVRFGEYYAYGMHDTWLVPMWELQHLRARFAEIAKPEMLAEPARYLVDLLMARDPGYVDEAAIAAAVHTAESR